MSNRETITEDVGTAAEPQVSDRETADLDTAGDGTAESMGGVVAGSSVESQEESAPEDQMETDRHPIPAILRLREEVRHELEQQGSEDLEEPGADSAPGPEPTESRTGEPGSLDHARDVLARLRARVQAQVLGRDDVIDLVLVALLADGHVLLEDFPGSGKTTLAKSLGTSIVDGGVEQPAGEEAADLPPIASFRRIQFTPDLLPSDVTGVSIFNATDHSFQFRQGPIFAHVVLADEINRTSPKVQAAMLEAMAEKQVTVDNVTYALDPLFFVIATQNPLDLAGTYPLPVAQLDRFLFKIRMFHIDRKSELEVLESWRDRRDAERSDLPKVSRDEVLAARSAIDQRVMIDDRIKEALVDIAQTIRSDDRVLQGCSTRSLVLILPALQALATLRGRDYVSTDDLATLIPRVLGHRLELAPGLSNVDEVIDDALSEAVEGLSRSTLRRR